MLLMHFDNKEEDDDRSLCNRSIDENKGIKEDEDDYVKLISTVCN